jgi:hypothetical protein
MANQQTKPNKKTLQSIVKLYQFNIIWGAKRGGKLTATIRVITICLTSNVLVVLLMYWSNGAGNKLYIYKKIKKSECGCRETFTDGREFKIRIAGLNIWYKFSFSFSGCAFFKHLYLLPILTI